MTFINAVSLANVAVVSATGVPELVVLNRRVGVISAAKVLEVEFDTGLAVVSTTGVPELVVLNAGTAVAFIMGIADVVSLPIGGGMTKPEELSKALSGEVHSEIKGNIALKTFCDTLTELKGDGSNGSPTSNPTSHEMETLASTKASGPRVMGSFDRSVVVFEKARPGAVTLLAPPQFSGVAVVSFASRRGRSRLAVTSAFS